MKTLFISTQSDNSATLQIQIKEQPMPTIHHDEVLIKVIASGVNASDALATIGYFDHAITPRIPGRDFAGTIVKGPEHLIGQHVWGTGGAAGIDFNGTQAEYIALSEKAVAIMPTTLDHPQAGSVTLPYVTAYYALVERSCLTKGESCLIIGALGQVGRAALSIATWLGAKPIAVVRGHDDLNTAKRLGFLAIDSQDEAFTQRILEANHQQPVDVILNTVGNLLWQPSMQVLAEQGRLATISAPPNFRQVDVNIFELYRANQTLLGVNTVPLDYEKNAHILNALKPGFETNQFHIPSHESMAIYHMEDATSAYQAVLDRTSDKRVIIKL